MNEKQTAADVGGGVLNGDRGPPGAHGVWNALVLLHLRGDILIELRVSRIRSTTHNAGVGRLK